MKKSKKVISLLAILMSLVLCLGLTACGSNVETKPDENLDSTQEAENKSEVNEIENKNEDAEDDDDVTFTDVVPGKQYVICDECCLIHNGTPEETVICLFEDMYVCTRRFGTSYSQGLTSSGTSHSDGQGSGESWGYSTNQSVSQGVSVGESYSESVTNSVSQSHSSSETGSSDSYGVSVGQTESVTNSVSQGHSSSVSSSSDSYGTTGGYSGSVTNSVSQSHSTTVSISRNDKCGFTETDYGYYIICPVSGKKHVVRWVEEESK